LALLAGTAFSACTTTYNVEGRETPIHVWLTAPDMPAEGGTIDALIYVGPEKVVEGPVHFPAGTKTINFPAVRVRMGETLVSAVVRRGTVAAREEFDVEGESWVQVLVRGGTVELRFDDQQPNPWGE
jgi:hypothetical protein